MEILYCNIGEMKDYDGDKSERPIGGGSYTSREVGHEVNNFTDCNGKLYGFVQSSSNKIAVEKHFASLSVKKDYAEHIMVIWTVGKKKIIGWYKDATVYRNIQHLKEEQAVNRKYTDFNIVSTNGFLLPENERWIVNMGFGRSNIWYGDENKGGEINRKIISYIESYEKDNKELIEEVESTKIIGSEKEALVKVRVNQSKFRERLLDKYNRKCCLCDADFEPTLIASHIKPWAESDENEKVKNDNGLLLCPNHDRLFDRGYISFDDEGKIIISKMITKRNQDLLNISESMKIQISGEMATFLKWHREKYKDNLY